jgi:hypothetical protein
MYGPYVLFQYASSICFLMCHMPSYAFSKEHSHVHHTISLEKPLRPILHLQQILHQIRRQLLPPPIRQIAHQLGDGLILLPHGEGVGVLRIGSES